jgi:DNA-binding transcriptional MerR regulator
MLKTSYSIPDKMFFKIGEVSKLSGIKPYILRYWESEFKLIKPQKSKTGQRVYRHQDIQIILRLKELLYEERYTIEGAKKKITQEIKKNGSKKLSLVQPQELVEILQRQEREIKELIQILKK